MLCWCGRSEACLTKSPVCRCRRRRRRCQNRFPTTHEVDDDNDDATAITVTQQFRKFDTLNVFMHGKDD